MKILKTILPQKIMYNKDRINFKQNKNTSKIGNDYYMKNDECNIYCVKSVYQEDEYEGFVCLDANDSQLLLASYTGIPNCRKGEQANGLLVIDNLKVCEKADVKEDSFIKQKEGFNTETEIIGTLISTNELGDYTVRLCNGKNVNIVTNNKDYKIGDKIHVIGLLSFEFSP